MEKLAATLDHDVKAVSAHLKVLAKAGLVAATREALHARYALRRAPRWRRWPSLLRETAEQIDRDLAGLVHEVVPKAHVDLRQAVDAAGRGQIVLIDLRPAEEEYAAGHLPNAVSMPLDELEARMGELAQDAVLVAYCRGPYCFQALEAKRSPKPTGGACASFRRASWNGRAAARRSRSRRPEAERSGRGDFRTFRNGRKSPRRPERQGRQSNPPSFSSGSSGPGREGPPMTVVNRPVALRMPDPTSVRRRVLRAGLFVDGRGSVPMISRQAHLVSGLHRGGAQARLRAGELAHAAEFLALICADGRVPRQTIHARRALQIELVLAAAAFHVAAPRTSARQPHLFPFFRALRPQQRY